MVSLFEGLNRWKRQAAENENAKLADRRILEVGAYKGGFCVLVKRKAVENKGFKRGREKRIG